MASNGGPCVERAEDIVEEDRQVLSFACPVRPEASMDALIPDASLRCLSWDSLWIYAGSPPLWRSASVRQWGASSGS